MQSIHKTKRYVAIHIKMEWAHSQILGMFPVELFVGEMLSTPVKTS